MYPAEPTGEAGRSGYSDHVLLLKAQSDQPVACDRLSFIQVDVTSETRQPSSSGDLKVFNRPKARSESRAPFHPRQEIIDWTSLSDTGLAL